MDDEKDQERRHRNERGQFVAGHASLGGRPKGSRNRLGEEFLEKLYADFAEHGPEAIARVREEKPDQYLKVIASLLPKEVKVSTEADLSDEELDRRIRQLAAALDLTFGEGEAVH
ncbi:hypothetical protein GGQ86_004260 [Xanthobacter flavus]|uniref:Uncharacterized protein n=1 Tax=Xanthobacter flavus TaxID=281 RepID=A0A9W6CPP0_XANFL|nr:hypothetical protein [Xanthobacter flavus]MDR6335764.1 hypothetical protein [Xanthobacter flavus]GLI24559.1 hypothetical protein XFLAVUS301_42330 [Xanthobacter flavus]